MVAAATIRIMKIAWVTYLGALSRLTAILIPRISAHSPILAQCKVHRPWALFYEGTVICNCKGFSAKSTQVMRLEHYKEPYNTAFWTRKRGM